MELSDFVKTALMDIVRGVEDAQTELADRASVGTTNHHRAGSLPSNLFQDNNGRLYSVVDFDVAVTTTDRMQGGGGINVFSIKAGGSIEGVAETASRIKFALTVRFPA